MKKHLKNLIALLITIVFTFMVVHKIDVSEMVETFQMFNPLYLACLIPFFMLIMTLRAKRWQILLPKNCCKFYDLYEIYMTSNLLNIFLPARAGDIFRGCYFGQKYNHSKLNIIGTVGAERILDGLTVLGLLLAGIILHNKSELAIHLAISAAVLFVCSFVFVLWVYKNNKIDYICEFIKENTKFLPEKIREKTIKLIDTLNPYLNAFIKGFGTFATPKALVSAAFYSIISWLGDCIFIYILLMAFGIKTTFIITFFILSFLALSTIIPSTSIYIGLYQYAFIQALALFEIEKSPALSIALSQQGIMLIAYMVIAAIFMLRHHIKIKDFKEEVRENAKNT